MSIYLPIAEMNVNILLIVFIGMAIGLLSGLFGVGGGFLMTPFLIFMGIPPAYAVANEANNILASSTSGSLTHWFKKTMDLKMGWMITLGGMGGTALGILTFGYFKEIGKIDLIITLAYMYVLAIIGSFMLRDGIMEIDRIKKKVIIKKKLHTHYWIHGLPFRMKFKKSKVYESAIVPILLGLDALKRKGGTLLAQGEVAKFPEFPLSKVTNKYVTIKSARGHNYLSCELALKQLSSNRFPLELITTHRLGLEDTDLAIKSVGGTESEGVIHVSLLPWQ